MQEREKGSWRKGGHLNRWWARGEGGFAKKDSRRVRQLLFFFMTCRYFKSANCYFLTYIRRNAKRRHAEVDTSLPEHLKTLTEEQNEAFKKEREGYEERINSLKQSVKEHKEECSEILPSMRVKDVLLTTPYPLKWQASENHNWIALDWLQKWSRGDIQGAEIKEIDNSSLVCPHDKLRCQKIEEMKCITEVRFVKFF